MYSLSLFLFYSLFFLSFVIFIVSFLLLWSLLQNNISSTLSLLLSFILQHIDVSCVHSGIQILMRIACKIERLMTYTAFGAF